MYFEHKKGLRSEELVASWFNKNGWEVLGQRIKTPYAEIDLLVIKNNIIKIIEVKSIRNKEFMSHRISVRQKQRLSQAYGYFSNKFSKTVEIEIAFVDRNENIEFIEFC